MPHDTKEINKAVRTIYREVFRRDRKVRVDNFGENRYRVVMFCPKSLEGYSVFLHPEKVSMTVFDAHGGEWKCGV